jgi:hypothetical protein
VSRGAAATARAWHDPPLLLPPPPPPLPLPLPLPPLPPPPPAAGRVPQVASLAVLDRAAGWFVAPPGDAPRPATAPAVLDHAPRALVLGSAAGAPPVAAALAGALRARSGAAAAVAAVWSPRAGDGHLPSHVAEHPPSHVAEHPPSHVAEHPPSQLALPGARRLAARLSARGIGASARGRLAWVALPRDDRPAAAAAVQAGAAVDVPLAVALAGPRTPALDALLADQDLIVVVVDDLDGPLGRLALASLAGFGALTVASRPLRGPARLAALAGFGGLRSLDEPLRAAVRALG